MPAEPDTRTRLLTAAEHLFAARGVDNVSLREISRAAGARNSVALQYHFGDRDGIITAILDKHRPALELARHEMLDRFEADPATGLRGLAAALVEPYARKLDDPDGGTDFLQIQADLLNRPNPFLEPASLEDPGNSLYRWRRLVDPLLDPDAARLHRRFTAVAFTITELGRRARAEGRSDHRLFTSTVVDHVAALLAAEVSPQTRSLLGRRPDRIRSA